MESTPGPVPSGGLHPSHESLAHGGPLIPVRVLFVMGTFLLSVLLYVDRVCISAAESAIALDLGLSKTQMGWVMSAFALGYALCQTPSGWLADRLGPRRVLTTIVILWSLFTGLTAAAFNFVSLLVIRLLFGAGEAGAFPGIARASYSWIPMKERGIVQGINFSGSRLGAAFTLPLLAALIGSIGWRASFFILMLLGLVWAGVWFVLFRDDPAEVPAISPRERQYILANRQQQPSRDGAGGTAGASRLGVGRIASSPTIWLLSAQYFASNFTFFFCLTWLFPHLKTRYAFSGWQTGLLAAIPLLAGAVGNWLAGWLVDRIYRRDQWVLSRRLPAVIGFALTAVGHLGYLQAQAPFAAVGWFSLAILGADMTLAPSWSACIDVGRRHAGVVSGTMNMAGNLGAFLTALAFPYLAAWTGSDRPFFLVATALALFAILAWMVLDPRQPLDDALPAAGPA